MARTAYDVQRDFALSSGLRSAIIWDSLAAEQSDVLKQKLADLFCDGDKKNAKVLVKRRQLLFDNVWRQRIYTNRTLLSAIIYVLVSPEKDPTRALQSTDYSCHPVIRTRKCTQADGGGNSEGCCMIFIDEQARVYGSWEMYLRNNALPGGTMIAPAHGVYTFSGEEDAVQLVVQATAASWLNRKVLNVSDKLVSIGGLMATVPMAATLALPVAAPILIAASAVGVSAAAYSTVRSATRLIDRSWHGQSTSLQDGEARSSWLGVAGGVAGLGATGATTALTLVGRRASTVAQLAVKGINVSSLVISGTGVLNGVYDLYVKISDDQPLGSYDVLQIASSLVIFTHNINNLRLVAKVTNGYSLRQEVRQQSRKAFDRIAQETNKLHSSSGSAKFDIVRIINDIPYKEALLNLHKIHTHLSQGVSLVSAVGAAGLLPSFVQLTTGGQLHLDVERLAGQLGCKFVQQIGNLGSFTDVLDGLMRYYSDKAVQLLLHLTRTFVEQHVEGIDRTLNTFVSTELVLYRMLMYCISNYKSCAVEFLEQRRHEILDVVAKYFQSLQPEPKSDQNCRRRKCPSCQGVYYMSTL